MPDTSFKLKRPLTSVFGEGTVVKRTRTEPHEKPKSSDDRSSTSRAGPSTSRFPVPSNGFRTKPVSSPAGGQKPPRPRGLPANQKEALAGFGLTVTSKTPARSKRQEPFRALRMPPMPPPDAVPSNLEPRKEMAPMRSRIAPPDLRVEQAWSSTTPLRDQLRPPDLRPITPKMTTPARKVTPFRALLIPAPGLILDGTSTDSATTMKPLPALKFDLAGGRPTKGKLTAMTALETPAVDLLPEENVIVGEALELQRGLLVSPEKGDRKRGRFIRNGLAERAQQLITRSSTALALWQKDIESSASRLGPGRFQADLRLRVKSVIHTSRNATPHSHSRPRKGTLRSVLATCSMPTGETRSVLFSFVPDRHDSHVPGAGDVEGDKVEEGAEVLVWRPWQETSYESTLFCSRFLILPSSS